MINKLKKILLMQDEELNKLLQLLEKQHKLILNKNVFELEAIVDEIRIANKNVAQAEVARRQLIKDNSIKEIIDESNDKELDLIYRQIKQTITSIKFQNETNDMLLKQQLIFTNKLLNIINPSRNVKTYNSYGRI